MKRKIKMIFLLRLVKVQIAGTTSLAFSFALPPFCQRHRNDEINDYSKTK